MNAAPSTLAVEDWKAVVRNTLLGFCRVRLPSMWDTTGKLQWSPVVSFATREASDKWNGAVLAAVRLSHPHALDELPPPGRDAS